MGKEDHTLFFSHASADRAWAEWIACELEADSCTPFVQARDFRPGMKYVTMTQKGVTGPHVVLVVLSAQFLKVCLAEAEWTTASAADPVGELWFLIPIWVHDCKLPSLLRAGVYIDLVRLTDEAAPQSLLDGLKKRRAKATKPPLFTGSAKPGPAFPPGGSSTI